MVDLKCVALREAELKAENDVVWRAKVEAAGARGGRTPTKQASHVPRGPSIRTGIAKSTARIGTG